MQYNCYTVQRNAAHDECQHSRSVSTYTTDILVGELTSRKYKMKCDHEYVNSRGYQNDRPPDCTLTAPRRPIRGQEIYDNQSQSAMGGSEGTLYRGSPGTMYLTARGCKGTLYRGPPVQSGGRSF